MSELEKRNAELAALLQQEREASQQQAQHSNHLVSRFMATLFVSLTQTQTFRFKVHYHDRILLVHSMTRIFLSVFISLSDVSVLYPAMVKFFISSPYMDLSLALTSTSFSLALTSTSLELPLSYLVFHLLSFCT